MFIERWSLEPTTRACGALPLLLAVVILGATASATSAQSTREEEIAQQKAEKAARLRPPVRDTGDVVVTRAEAIVAPDPPALKPVLGGFRANAGLGAGASFVSPAGHYGLWVTSAAWSIHNFKTVSSGVESRGMFGGRTTGRAVVTWLDEPTLTFYGVGLQAPASEKTDYGLRTTDAHVDATTRVGRWFTYGGQLGAVDTRSRDVAIGPASTLLDTEIPGLGANVTWATVGASVAIDTRRSPGYTDHGGLYRLAWRGYRDRSDVYSFARTDLDVRQFVPVLHSNWVVALQARAQVVSPGAGNVVPYFMLPAIGGRDTLPGFDDYRFADRASLLLRSELRWSPTPVLDMALLLDDGTVAARWRDLSTGGLQRAWGVGLRLHSYSSTLLRLEVAHSVEGWRYNLAQGVSF